MGCFIKVGEDQYKISPYVSSLQQHHSLMALNPPLAHPPPSPVPVQQLLLDPQSRQHGGVLPFQTVCKAAFSSKIFPSVVHPCTYPAAFVSKNAWTAVAASGLSVAIPTWHRLSWLPLPPSPAPSRRVRQGIDPRVRPPGGRALDTFRVSHSPSIGVLHLQAGIALELLAAPGNVPKGNKLQKD